MFIVRRKKVIAATTMAEASSQRELLRTLLLTGGTTPEHRFRLGEYASSWMSGKIPTLKPSTRDKYAVALDQHILPALGDYYVDAITPQDILQWRDAQRGKPRTINSRLRLLRTLLRGSGSVGHSGRAVWARPRPARSGTCLCRHRSRRSSSSTDSDSSETRLLGYPRAWSSRAASEPITATPRFESPSSELCRRSVSPTASPFTAFAEAGTTSSAKCPRAQSRVR